LLEAQTRVALLVSGLVPGLDLVFVRIGDRPFPYSWDFEKELVKRVLAAVEV
jgi:hypothetical protein